MKQRHSFDVLIIGSGAAGLTAALQLPPATQIAIISKGTLNEGCTFYAQGGIAAATAIEDSVESHIQDTLIAGAGLCDPNTVQFTAARSTAAISWLIDQGVSFTKETRPDGRLDYHLTREGGHSHRRVLHALDATGQAISTTLSQRIQAQAHIKIFQYYVAIDFILRENQCIGAYVLNIKSNQVEVFQAKVCILATGGASKVYLYTSNPDATSGDGIAMAWRAGCRVANMEFNQFHPTCLYHPNAKSFLITEAIRGEGGILRLKDGTRFMQHYDARAELAPRDVVAKAIDHEIKRLGIDCVYLDISHKSTNFIKQHFPHVYKNCLHFGLDITQQAIPVVPAAHYTCGGVVTNLYGQTDIPGLYAIGEVSCTGLHGANRMASNSLLECIVFASSAVDHIKQELSHYELNTHPPAWDESQVIDSDEQVVVTHNWQELRRTMWDYVGIVRTDKRLQRALRRINLLRQEIQDYYSHFKVGKNLLELRNLVLVAELIVTSAMLRKESRGLHYNLDYPSTSAEWAKNTVLIPDKCT